VVASGLLGFWQEKRLHDGRSETNGHHSNQSVGNARGNLKDVPLEEIVQGDVISLSAGDVVPADCLIIESKDLLWMKPL